MTMTFPDSNSTSARPEAAALGVALAEKRQENPGEAVFLVNRGLTCPEAFELKLRALLAQAESLFEGPIVLTTLSNSEPDLNPFAGLTPSLENVRDGEEAEQWVALLGTGRFYEWNRWPRHVALVSDKAAEVLADPGTHAGNSLTRLRAAGGRLMLSDGLFLFDPGRMLDHGDELEPHETRRPAAWGRLIQRLSRWLRHAGTSQGEALEVAALANADRPVTLHITHSWGGGVAQWVASFIDADEHGLNLQLRSEGPQSGKGCGQCYALYLGNRLETPLARWWLQPPILSTEAENTDYAGILREVAERYGVGRIVISSLVGHALDALATSLPTVQVLHDFYPAWPVLGQNPEPYLDRNGPAALETAIEESGLPPDLADLDAGEWNALASRWLQQVRNRGIVVAAPSRSVADLLRRLDAGWSAVDIEIIPHGLPSLPGDAVVEPRDREDGRLRLVIPGRIQPGKGKQLLLDALPELTPLAQVVLLGAGKDGEDFFGISGVDVIPQYRREELRHLLSGIGPHLAGLLSIVPETFSYTLSEMQQLDIPVVATRVGSLAERISDGQTGWLIEPTADALVEQIRYLAENRIALSEVRERLQDFDLPGARRMVARYGQICRNRSRPPNIGREIATAADQAGSLAFEQVMTQLESRRLASENSALKEAVEDRTRWAEERERALKQEETRRIEWVTKLETQLRDQVRQHHVELTAERDAFQRREEAQQQSIKSLEGMLQRLQAEHDWAKSTWSWRLTRPFRVVHRALANLLRAGVWNPLRWPLLLSQAGRTIRTRGWRGALNRLQRDQGVAHVPERIALAAVEAVGDREGPATMPRAEHPLVSIVIPVFNKWEYTAACLRSLAETPSSTGFEVIVVDDQSTDETEERLRSIEGLVCLRNEENQGFIGSCNRGAAEARGRYLVMLNNDTQVLEGWLEALLDTFEAFPDTGLAGARLVYPDGRLQEAGGIIFNDGSGWNYGKNGESDHPDYQYVREADYCSGACIMLPRALFEELGGFDSHYAPAYYEDTDLAFRIRQKGLRVRVQPAATIVHHEGVTSGTDIGSGVKRHQAVNREKFLERWQTELAGYSPPIVNPRDPLEIRRARDFRLRGRVLVIDAYTPEPDQDSGSLRLTYLLHCLRDLGYGVTFLPDNLAFAGAYTTRLQQAGIEAVYAPWVQSLQRFFGERGAEFDFIMISRHYVASKYTGLIRRHCPQAKFIFDTVDLHYLREERQAELEDSLPLRRSAAQTRRSELGVIEAADATLVVSPVEKTVLAEAAPDARVHVISNVHGVTGSQKPFAERKDLFFVGGYQHPPNIDAARWFVGSIWPLVRKELPDAVFHLIGSKAPDEVRALQGDGVQFHGYVEAMEPWLDSCRLSVAPLRYGAGVKGKVNASMARGQPVVATPMAVEGLFAKPGQDVLVAETAEDFAEQVVRLYRDEDLWNRISAGGLQNVERYFSVETARRGLEELLESL